MLMTMLFTGLCDSPSMPDLPTMLMLPPLGSKSVRYNAKRGRSEGIEEKGKRFRRKQSELEEASSDVQRVTGVLEPS